MQESYIIGIDIGTGSTKAVAVDAGNRVLGTAQEFYPTTAEGEKSEQDPVAVWQAFQKTVAQLVKTVGHPPGAISLSSAMHSILAVDENGAPLTNAMLWSDTRSSGIAANLRASAVGENIYLATGTPLHSMSPLCKIRWLKEAEPTVFAQANKFLSIKEFIWFQLFGEYVIDHSLASATGLFNVHQLQWEEIALQFAGISPQQLSLPVPVTYVKKGLQATQANAMALPRETQFFIGASDGTLANLGSLCLKPTEVAVTIGTSAAVRVTSSRPVQNAERMIFNYLLDEHSFVCGGAVNNGGNVFQWLLEDLFAQHKTVTGYEELFAVINTVAPGSDGLLFLPYLHGERAPIWDERSSGAFIGLQAMHGLPHLARAAAEGVCFALNHILSSLEEVCGRVEKLLVSGGLVHSAAMMQLLADVTGKNVVVQHGGDASAVGAVYLAQKALGIIDDYASIPAQNLETFNPQNGVVPLYQQRFVLYKNLYPLLKDTFHSLHQQAR